MLTNEHIDRVKKDGPAYVTADRWKELCAQAREANELHAKLAALAKAYDEAPGLPLEAPGADLVWWTDVLIGFGHILNDEIMDKQQNSGT